MVRAALLGLLVAGCGLLPGPAPSDYDVHVGNGTTLEVALRVNGRVVRVFAPGELGTLAAGALGPLPWTVDGVTSRGRVLLTMTVTAGSVGCTDHPDGSRECRGVVARADLSCGRLELYASGTPPEGPPPGPGVPGDCEP